MNREDRYAVETATADDSGIITRTKSRGTRTTIGLLKRLELLGIEIPICKSVNSDEIYRVADEVEKRGINLYTTSIEGLSPIEVRSLTTKVKGLEFRTTDIPDGITFDNGKFRIVGEDSSYRHLGEKGLDLYIKFMELKQKNIK